jgi:hypothetical protein
MSADGTYYLTTYVGFKPLLTSQFADWYQALHPVLPPSRGRSNLAQKKRAFVHRLFLKCAWRNACEDAHVVAHVQSTVARSGPQHQGLEVAQPEVRLAVGRNVIILAPARAWWAGSTVQEVGLVGARLKRACSHSIFTHLKMVPLCRPTYTSWAAVTTMPWIMSSALRKRCCQI